jgi:NAD(P)-dependent dehydrogenase (short-subunit alcohol dehydrogenase family)
VAIVTGDGGNRACRRSRTGRTGAHVAVLGKTQDPEVTCKEVLALGRGSVGFQWDIAEGRFLDRVVYETPARWDHIDVLVNSAGMGVRAPAADFSDTDRDRIMMIRIPAMAMRQSPPVGAPHAASPGSEGSKLRPAARARC